MRQPDDRALLLDMLLAAREARALAAGSTRESLAEDRVLFLALQKLVENIGEAASRLSEGARSTLPVLPWKDIVGMRHRLVHDYMRVDLDRVWLVIETDLDALIAEIEHRGITPEPEGA
ncbi:MAG: DUF86 domain-containing protein [Chloroflexota bacterium]|nr:DUF86 domain-containing protein [Chloroflexota bacterium]